MCHFDNFDIDQIASKLAQRWNSVHSFYCKNISVLDSFDNAKNAKRHLFFGHPIYTYIEIGIDMFHAFMTEGVLEQLFSSFNAALDGICS